ncbi:Survival protein SurA precursor (Peptidyl-prolyl cis-trans isomerase SurA) [Candidatus Sumerlaea chitinivorans]|jgi:parvulin-like peptidyl-prolyl isomerase|uniref:peptidylprolyl isomerase n=1 Tax=Sumerlaea chitinivorans TaxID=2250252 RepID=A0A2Z4Y8H0_SUMC1|nr:Survival protein SurA precursor (Peptidyl-prolyl cis-trans isomerase SurA) [Candidatus Sumerlaea chitinivorans]
MKQLVRQLVSLIAVTLLTLSTGSGWAEETTGTVAKDGGTTPSESMEGALAKRLARLPEVLATYDGGQFTKEELSATLQLRKPRALAQFSPAVILNASDAVLREVVKDFLYERFLYEKAKTEGIDENTSTIREKLAEYEGEVFNRLYYERVFAKELEKAREERMRELYEQEKATKYTVPGVTKLAEIYLSAYKSYEVKSGETLAEIAKREAGDPQAVRRILREDPFHFYRRSPGVETGEVDYREVQAGEKLLVPLKKDELTSKEALAKKLRAEAIAGADFLELAEKHSDAPASRRKEVFKLESDMMSEVQRAVEQARGTSITEVVRSPHGFHILKIMDRTETQTLSFEQVRNKIELSAEDQRRIEDTARRNLFDRLSSKYKLEMNTEALRRDDPGGTDPLTASTWLARIGDFRYTYDDFQREVLPYQKSWRGMNYDERLKFLRSSPKIVMELVKRESKALGLEKDPVYRSEMESKKIIEVTTEWLRRREQSRKPPTDEELRAWYEQHLDKFTGAEKVKLREITKRVNLLLPDAERQAAIESAKKQLNDIRSKIRTVQDFEEYARRESDAIATRSRGGLIGVVPTSFRGDAFRNEIAKLKVGQISEPFLYGSEVMIIMLEEKIPAPVVSFEEALPKVRRMYELEQTRKGRDLERDELFKEKRVELKF